MKFSVFWNPLHQQTSNRNNTSIFPDLFELDIHDKRPKLNAKNKKIIKKKSFLIT